MSQIVNIFLSGENDDKALNQLKRIRAFCKEKNFYKEEGLALSAISNIFSSTYVFDSAIFYLKPCLALRKKVADTKSIARTYYLLAHDYFNLGFSNYRYFDSSLQKLNKSIEHASLIDDEELDNTNMFLLSQIYNRAGSSEKSLEILISPSFRRPSSNFQLANYYYELSEAYYNLKSFSLARKYIDSALTITDDKRAKNLRYKFFLREGMIFNKLGEFRSAKQSFINAKTSYIEQFPNGNKKTLFSREAKVLYNEGELMIQEDRWEDGLEKFQQSITFLDSSEILDPLYILAYEGLAEAFAQKGDLKKGMEAYKMASEWKGKIYDQVSTEKAYGTEIFVENTDLKKSNIFYQELADTQRKSMRIQQLAGGGILTILLFFFYQLFQRQKIQKQLIATKNQLLEEKEQTHKQRLMALTGRYNERMAQTVMQVQQEAQTKFRKQMIEVGEELHDFAQGKIAIGKTLLTKLKDDLSNVLSDQDRQNYDLISEAMNAAHQEIRDQSHRLQEGKALDLHINLEDFLHKLKNDLGPLQQIGELTLNLETHNLEELAFNEKDFLDIIGLVQGAINNVILHADAETVYVKLERAEDTFQIEIADDGQGFELEGEGISEASGLQALQNRVDRLGGSMSIYSEPGKGTKLLAEVPLRT